MGLAMGVCWPPTALHSPSFFIFVRDNDWHLNGANGGIDGGGCRRSDSAEDTATLVADTCAAIHHRTDAAVAAGTSDHRYRQFRTGYDLDSFGVTLKLTLALRPVADWHMTLFHQYQ